MAEDSAPIFASAIRVILRANQFGVVASRLVRPDVRTTSSRRLVQKAASRFRLPEASADALINWFFVDTLPIFPCGSTNRAASQ